MKNQATNISNNYESPIVVQYNIYEDTLVEITNNLHIKLNSFGESLMRCIKSTGVRFYQYELLKFGELLTRDSIRIDKIFPSFYVISNSEFISSAEIEMILSTNPSYCLFLDASRSLNVGPAIHHLHQIFIEFKFTDEKANTQSVSFDYFLLRNILLDSRKFKLKVS